jgi:acyl-CoA oxidase
MGSMKTESRRRADPAHLEAAQVRAFLDGRWGWVRDEVRRELRDPLFRSAYGLPIEQHRELTLRQAQALARTRGPGLMFPKEYGGEGELGAGIVAFEVLGFSDISLVVNAGVQWGLFGGAIWHLGTDKHHARYLPPMIPMELIGCFAMTETGHGSDVQSLRTTATYDEATDEFVINTPDEDARKDYIGNAARDARMAVVFAQLLTGGRSNGVHALLVPIRHDTGEPLPGITIEDDGHKGGLNGVDNGRIWFDNVRVSRDALLDRHGRVARDGTYSSPIENPTRRFFTMLGTLVQGRVSVAGSALAAAKTALTIAVRYGLLRRQFRPPDSEQEVVLLDYRQHQRRLLPALATTYALSFAQDALVSKLHDVFTNDRDDMARRELESMAAGIKAIGTWHALQTIQACREACGGAGYLSSNRLVGLRDDIDVFTTFEGDNTVLLQLVAKGLLTDYKEEFGSLDTLRMVRFVAEQVIETLLERTTARSLAQRLAAALPVPGAEQNLLDREVFLALFGWREQHVVAGVARRLKRSLDEGLDTFEAFNRAQDHVLLAARAHVETLVLESFDAAVASCEDPGVRALLERVLALHALSTIERERGWFLEHGRLSPSQSKAVTATVNDLCGQLRPYAGLLVDAFGIPDEVLDAPLALGEEERRQRAKTGR